MKNKNKPRLSYAQIESVLFSKKFKRAYYLSCLEGKINNVKEEVKP